MKDKPLSYKRVVEFHIGAMRHDAECADRSRKRHHEDEPVAFALKASAGALRRRASRLEADAALVAAAEAEAAAKAKAEAAARFEPTSVDHGGRSITATVACGCKVSYSIWDDDGTLDEFIGYPKRCGNAAGGSGATKCRLPKDLDEWELLESQIMRLAAPDAIAAAFAGWGG